MGLKVAVVGGGSTYTPELVEGFARRATVLPIDELVLLDPDPERLEVVGGLAGRILRRAGWPGRLTLTGDRSAALDGAAFTLIQLRVGGQAARLVDETLPLKFGLIGQETTGPGGFAKALRTVPLVLEIAEESARRGAPGSWILDFTNPVGIVTQALLDAGHHAHRAVQRGDRVPARAGPPLRRRARAGLARPRRAQPPVVDPGGPGRRRRPPAGAARGRRRGGDPRR